MRPERRDHNDFLQVIAQSYVVIYLDYILAYQKAFTQAGALATLEVMTSPLRGPGLRPDLTPRLSLVHLQEGH